MKKILETSVPKPRKKRKAKPKFPKRSPIKKTNAKRKASEFARCYGSKDRVEFVRSLRCIVCAVFGGPWVYSDNAHTENGGAGRKGPFTSIIPLCRRHHQGYDQHVYPLSVGALRDSLNVVAGEVEKEWQAYRALRTDTSA